MLFQSYFSCLTVTGMKVCIAVSVEQIDWTWQILEQIQVLQQHTETTCYQNYICLIPIMAEVQSVKRYLSYITGTSRGLET